MNHRRHVSNAMAIRWLSCDASPRLALVLFLWLVICLLLRIHPARAEESATRVHVRGIARIDAHAWTASGGLRIAGRVTDDSAAGARSPSAPLAPRPPASVRLRVARAAETRAVSLASAAPVSCQSGVARPILASAEELLLGTDAGGRFCVQVTLPIDRYEAHLETTPFDRMDGAKLDLPFDLALRSVSLAFDGVTVLALDEETTSIDVTAKQQDAADGHTAAAGELALTLSDESGAMLGEARTNVDGHARFAVPARRLGPPGRGELRASFAGSANAQAATTVTGIERRTGVVLEVRQAVGGRLPPAAIDDEVEIRVLASATCRTRGCTAVPTGTIQVQAGTQIVGAAPLERGAARVVAQLDPLAAREDAVTLSVRYVPDGPWFASSNAPSVVLPVRPQGPWSHVVLVVAGAALIVWLAIVRFPRRTRLLEESSRPEAVREPAPRVELVRPGAPGLWTGHVVDAHDGAAVAGARIAMERPAFRDVQIVAQAVSDPAGAFLIRYEQTIAGDELVIESPTHATVRRPVPPPGEVEVALVQRRRLLVDPLVAWARRRGRPFDGRPEPTPGHVRRAAGRFEFEPEQRAQAARIQEWAGAVEMAAYSGLPIDARAQAEVERLGPADAPKPEDRAGQDLPAPKKPKNAGAPPRP